MILAGSGFNFYLQENPMDIEAELRKSMPEEELERGIKEKIKSFHGLLTREVAIRLIAKEKGLMKEEEKEFKIAEIPKGGRKICFRGEVRKIWPAAIYSSGKKSRVVEVSDETGWKPLVLWNDDTKIGDRLRLGDGIMVRGAYEKGGEIGLSYSGTLEVEKRAGFSPLAALREGESAHVRGTVHSIEGTDTFIRGKTPAWGFAFRISDGESERRCIIIEGLDRAQRIRKGDDIRIESATLDNGNLYLDSGSRIMVRRVQGRISGNVTSLESEGERLVLHVDGKAIELGRDKALLALGVNAAPDIMLSTVVALKKDKLLNSRITVKVD
jgi:hypothetical protein